MRSLSWILLISINVAFANNDCPLGDDQLVPFVSELQVAVDRVIRPPSKSCQVKELVNCNLFENSNDQYIDIGGGKHIPNLTIRGEPVRESEISESERRYGESTFQEVKEMMLSEIAKGREFSQLTPYERNMYERIRTVAFKGLYECNSSRPNGTYDGGSHSVEICPGYLKLPKTNLVKLFSHELAHAIDHCHMMHHMYDKNPTVAQGQEEFPFLRGDSQYMANSPRLERFEASTEKVQMALDSGYITLKLEGQNPADYPLLSQFACLEVLKGKSAQDFKVPDNEDCSYSRSTIGEDSADLWSAKIVDRYLKDNPFTSELERQAFLFENVPSTCRPKDSNGKKMISDGPGRKSKSRVVFSHSSDDFRVEEIYFARPSIQEAMQCIPVEKSCSAR